MSHVFKKAEVIPLTVVGTEGSAKRNILRKGTGGGKGGRKDTAAGKVVDDGSLAAEDDPIALDSHDPNYDSEDDEQVGYRHVPQKNYRAALCTVVGQAKMTLTAYKKAIEPIIKEYLASGEIDDVLASIDSIAAPEYSYEFVKKAINMSFDKGDRERERVSKLLSVAYPEVFSSNMIGKGFERLFELVDEIEKDAPAARDMLATFLARAVVDEVLPPSFLADAVVCNLGGEIVEHAKRMLSRDHGGARLERVWGPGDGRPVEELKVALDQLLLEYLLSRDQDEAARCIHELRAPEFMHEVVKRAVVTVLDKNAEEQSLMSSLLQYLMERDQLTKQQASKGFKRLHDLLPDLSLDVPSAGTIVAQFITKAMEDSVLPGDFAI